MNLTELGPVSAQHATGPDTAINQVHPGRGLYDTPIQVSLRSDVGDSFHFTTDGSLPSEQSAAWPSNSLRITTSTTLRLANFRHGRRTTVETHTYLFPQAVLTQTGHGFPKSWGTTNGQAVLADYEMDPDVVTHPDDQAALPAALRALPSVSIVTSRDALFDPERGLYANPLQSGREWERPASVEWLPPDGTPGFQIDCGLRIQGGWNRRPEESPKHSFRLIFTRRHGPGKCRYPFFGTGVQAFDQLILRAGCNNTWLHWSAEERRRGDYLRDQWMRDTLAAMGHPSARGVFVHLYLNGLYWGIYNLAERPSAPFAAAHLGGTAKQYDSRNGNNVLEGTEEAWKELIGLANAGLRGADAYDAIQRRLDVPQFIDYMLANLYGANADWDRSSNWYAARRRQPHGRFQFFVWDAERTLEQIDANALAVDDDESPTRLFQKLRENPVFRRDFAARAQRHLADGGPLSPAACARRYQALARQLGLALVAESARWGDYRRDFHPYRTGPYELYTVHHHWQPEVKRLLGEYFPQRTAQVIQQLKAAGLYPIAEAAWPTDSAKE